MNTISKTVASAVAAGAVLLNAGAGLAIFADTTISGNGAGSASFVTNTQTNTTTVSQDNSANVSNTVTNTQDTGHNTATFNTGGDVVIGTGSATSSVDISNALNANVAKLGCCSSPASTTTVSGNGALSTNVVNSTQDNTKTLSQNNDATVSNDVANTQNTGFNDASLNTGGSVTVATGGTASEVALSTRANANEAVIGSPAAASVSSTPAANIIFGNGAGSSNFITNTSDNSLTASQNNSADVSNDVAVSQDTGYNTGRFNTGGDVLIHTGSARSLVGIDNMLNFNHLSADCGCVTDSVNKIVGNGAGIGLHPSSDSFIFESLGGGNTITNTNDNSRTFSQDNSSDLSNETAFDQSTGYNDNSLSTAGIFGGDPWIVTGNTSNDVMTHNAGNLNVLGSGVDVTFDLSGLLGMLHTVRL